MAFGLFLDFKSVTRNSDSQAEVSKNGVHMTDANVKSVVTPQMTATGMCIFICTCTVHGYPVQCTCFSYQDFLFHWIFLPQFQGFWVVMYILELQIFCKLSNGVHMYVI